MLQALDYRQRILAAIPGKADFQPLMTCYLTDNTSPDEVYEAKEDGIVAYKLYPAGATTNSNSGITDFQTVIPTLKAMADVSQTMKHLQPHALHVMTSASCMTFVPITCFTAVHFLLYAQLRNPLIAMLSVPTSSGLCCPGTERMLCNFLC